MSSSTEAGCSGAPKTEGTPPELGCSRTPSLSSTSPAIYSYDDIDSNFDGHFALSNNVMGLIRPYEPGNYSISANPDALSYTEFKEAWPSLAEEYKTIVDHLLYYNKAAFGLFRLRLSEPTEDEATRLLQLSEEDVDLKAEICRDWYGPHLDNELLLSCVSMSTSDRDFYDPKGQLAKYKLTTESFRKMLLILLLLNADADRGSLKYSYDLFHCMYPIMMDFENRMPVPHIVLPSRLSTLEKPQVPQFFEVKWPIDNQVIGSSGVTDFFRDFYAMSVQRPYQKPPGFEFIKVLVNPICISSKSSQPKCLIVCSSHHRVQKPLHDALLRVRARQMVRDWSSIGSWSPLHDLMDCISVVYQIMLRKIEKFVRQQSLVLQAVKFHGRDHPWQSKFQYLYILEDQTAIAENALVVALRDLGDWMDADIHGVMLASVPGAEWPIRIERLKKDASYLISCLNGLTQEQDKVKSMLKERLDLNSGTRSLIIAIFASIYIPLAFISSYFGMNAKGFTDGGLTSTNEFWKISIPLVIASIIVPVAFSGLLIRKTMQIAFNVKAYLQQLLLWTGYDFLFPLLNRMIGYINLALLIISDLKRRRTKVTDEQDGRQRSSGDDEGVSNQSIEMV